MRLYIIMLLIKNLHLEFDEYLKFGTLFAQNNVVFTSKSIGKVSMLLALQDGQVAKLIPY